MKQLIFTATVLLSSLQISIQSPLHIQKRAAFYIANETACVVDNTVYYSGDPIPTDDPCEACKCRPPGFACVLKECEKKPGCRAIRRAGYCCPEYICGCEHNGRMYRDGDEIRDSQNPCYTCHCQGSSIACAFIDCFFRVDCAPEYVAGECCPHYNNCFTSGESNKTVSRDNVPTIHRIAKPDFYLTTLKDILKVTEQPLTTTTEISEDKNSPAEAAIDSVPPQKVESVPPAESTSTDPSVSKSTETPDLASTELERRNADLSTTQASEVSDSTEITSKPEIKPTDSVIKESEEKETPLDLHSTTTEAIKLSSEVITTTQIIPEQPESTKTELNVEEPIANVENSVESESDKENSIDVLLKSHDDLKGDGLTTLEAVTKSSQVDVTQESLKYGTTTVPRDDDKVITIQNKVGPDAVNEISTEASKLNDLILSTLSPVTQQEIGNSSAQGKNLKLTDGENSLETSESPTTKLEEVQITTQTSSANPQNDESTEIRAISNTSEHETDLKLDGEEPVKDSEVTDQVKSLVFHSSEDKLEIAKQEISITTLSPEKQITVVEVSTTRYDEETVQGEISASDKKLDTLEKEELKESLREDTTVIAVDPTVIENTERPKTETNFDTLEVAKEEIAATPEPNPTTTQKVVESSEQKAALYSDEQAKPKIEGSTTSITTGPIEVITKRPSVEEKETEKITSSEELTTIEAEN